MNGAFYAALASSLGLRSKDLAELGGFSDRFARDLLKGSASARFQSDVIEALELLSDDIDVMVDVMVDQDTLTVFRTNEQLRKVFRDWPARGQSAGGFIGPHRIAVVSAVQLRTDDELYTDVVWID